METMQSVFKKERHVKAMMGPTSPHGGHGELLITLWKIGRRLGHPLVISNRSEIVAREMKNSSFPVFRFYHCFKDSMVEWSNVEFSNLLKKVRKSHFLSEFDCLMRTWESHQTRLTNLSGLLEPDLLFFMVSDRTNNKGNIHYIPSAHTYPYP